MQVAYITAANILVCRHFQVKLSLHVLYRDTAFLNKLKS